MLLNSRMRDGVVIIEPHGKVTIGKGDVALRDAVHSALEAGCRKILIDLKKTTAMDSSGIAELVAAHSATRSQGGTLRLLNLSKKIYDVLGITQLITVFETFDDEEEAIASYSPTLESVTA